VIFKAKVEAKVKSKERLFSNLSATVKNATSFTSFYVVTVT